jgi:Zn-dependent peptidase ImmA (M78 family)/DNA-binding XRE family transcriptional regulator
MTKTNIGNKLKKLRNLFGYTLENVYKESGIVKSSISDFEKGKREPSLSQLDSLANLYHKPVSFFFLDEEDFTHPKMLWREKPSKESDRINFEEKFYKLCKQYLNLETWSKNIKKDSFKQLKAITKQFPQNYEQVEVMASEVSQLLRIGDKPGKKLFIVLEEEFSVKIFHGKFDGSAVSYYDNIVGPAVMLNNSNKQWRRNFDLAHELFHLITWDCRFKEDTSIEANKEEQFANIFATELLMPSNSIKKSVEEELPKDRKISIYFIDTLARQYEVSYEALLWRIKKLYKIGFMDKNYISKMSETVEKSHVNRESNNPSTLPKRYESLAMECLRRGEISLSQCARYLEKNISEVMKLDIYKDDSKNEVKVPANTM